MWHLPPLVDIGLFLVVVLLLFRKPLRKLQSRHNGNVTADPRSDHTPKININFIRDKPLGPTQSPITVQPESSPDEPPRVRIQVQPPSTTMSPTTEPPDKPHPEPVQVPLADDYRAEVPAGEQPGGGLTESGADTGQGLEKKKRAPKNIGGRPRGPKETTIDARYKRRSLQTACYCYKQNRTWHFGVEILDDSLADDSIIVKQTGQSLAFNQHNHTWQLHSLSDVVIFESNTGLNSVTLKHHGADVAIFKLFSQGGEAEGRLVRTATNGVYLAVVPDGWIREANHSGSPPVEPESTACQGLRAHYFVLEPGDGREISFICPDRKIFSIKRSKEGFRLSGNSVSDDHPYQGPIFFGKPPRLVPLDDDNYTAWNQVGVVIVGKEGPALSSKPRWRESISAGERQDGQLSLEPVERFEAGWFFVRIYDRQDDLLESYDFRYVKGVRSVEIKHDSFAYDAPGRKAVVSVEMETGWRLTEAGQYRDLAIPSNGIWEIQIPLLDLGDKVSWEFHSPSGRTVAWTVPLPRVRWAVGPDGAVPDQLTALLVPLRRDDLSAKSGKILRLHLPPSLRINGIQVGLNGMLDRTYRVTGDTLIIPLRDLCDLFETMLQEQTVTLRARFEPRGKTLSLARVRSAFQCPQCKDVFINSSDIVRHLVEQHGKDYLRPLPYEEIAELRPELPRYIYKCSYCLYFARSDDHRNPTSNITNHIESCPKADRTGGLPKVKFRPVKNPDEIRTYIEKTLPYFFKCKLCGKVLEIPYDRDPSAGRKRHLASHTEDLLGKTIIVDAEEKADEQS